MPQSSASAVKRDDFVAFVLLFVFAVGLGICVRPIVAPTAREASRQEIVWGLTNRLPETWTKAQQHLRDFPDDVTGLALAADAAALDQHNAEAIQLFERLPQDGGRWEFRREFGIGRRQALLGQLVSSERHFRRALQIHPMHREANQQLGHILQVAGRVWEAAPHFFIPILCGQCNMDELLCIATAELFFRRDEQSERDNQDLANPDLLLTLAAARRSLLDNQPETGEESLRQVLAVRPELGEAQGRLGRLIVERGDLGEFLQWRGSLPDEARDHPEVWFAQGLKARQLGLHPGSVRCFLEAVRRQPNHLNANIQLANGLAKVGQTDVARKLSRRAEVMSEIESNLNLLRVAVDDVVITKLISQLGSIGRYWEAAGWAYILTRLDIPQDSPRRELQRWLQLSRRENVPNATDQSPIRSLRVEDFPTPSWPTPQEKAAAEETTESTHIAWNFTDDAANLGIKFEYFEGSSEENRLQHIFNVMGGGLGAVDFDNDGWPDLYLAQANNWRESTPRPEDRDRLFRNVAGERFEDVTESAAIAEFGFSHGVAVGDFDQDGFADIYVGNKGPNRLFHNNGDGTFEEISVRAGVAGDEWTTSSVFADFTGDGLPDLYVLNYTKILETAQKECRTTDGTLKSCTPRQLPSEQDKLYVNRGDGTFRDVSEVAGILAPEGRGLGVVVWDFSGDGLPDIFIANDTSANFLWVHQGTDSEGVPHFQEEGVIRGVAFNQDGHATASMGVAAGDANGDGQIELFITNFFAESSTLFSLKPGGFFEEQTRDMNLRAASFWMLGFGCQFTDLDGDSWEDLIITNGHVDQKSSRGDADRLPPQIFRNQQGRRFADVPSNELGAFFQGRYLGRGLAKFDWNRDGRTDVGISHLHAPFALLTNRTVPEGQPLTVRLLGRSGCREPIGAKVTVHAGRSRIVRFLTGGDGFLVTNEHFLSFAVPQESQTVRLEVDWPGGRHQQWIDVRTNQEILLVEGQPEVMTQRQYERTSARLSSVPVEHSPFVSGKTAD
jgi:tetratricopeptide (TPR) repeat protein